MTPTMGGSRVESCGVETVRDLTVLSRDNCNSQTNGDH